MKIITGKIKSAQKICVYGPEGIGKSTFASRFPGALFIDTEGSTKHLDVARTPSPSSWTMLLGQVEWVKKNSGACQTLVVDTADWAEQLCISHICAKSNKDGIEDFGYGKGYTYLAEEFGRFLNLLNDLIELGINVVFTAHAQIKKFEQPDEMGAYDRWELKLQRKTAPLVKEWADMVLFANYQTVVVTDESTKSKKAQGGTRVMYTTHHPAWDAKNRHGLADKLPFDFEKISHCLPSGTGLPEQTSAVKQPKSEPEPKPAPVPEVVSGPNESDPLEGVPKKLADLMRANEVEVWEIQQVVSNRGYYPQNTPITNYDPNFIDGVLVGAWDQVLSMIVELKDNIPF